MPELRWTLLILGALFIGGLALWEWRRQRHARGPDNLSSHHLGGGGAADGQRVSPTFDGSGSHSPGFDGAGGRISPTFDGGGSGRDGGRISPTFGGAGDHSFPDGSASLTPTRGTFREPTLTFPEVSVEIPADSRDRFADPPVVELDDESLDRLKVEAGEAVDEFSEPREAGEAVDDFSENLDEPSPAAPMVPRLSPAAVAPTLAPASGFAAGRGAESQGQRDSRGHDPYDSAGADDARHEAAGQGASARRGELRVERESDEYAESREPGAALDPHDEPTTRFEVESASASEAVSASRPVAGMPLNTDSLDPVEPIVDWPEEDTRKIVALRLVSGTGERFAGRAVRQALAAEGFVLGKFDIFHKPGPDARAVLSAASLTKPGTFSLGTMDAQRFGGISLFAVLPGPLSPLATFDELLTTARALNDRLRGALQDERGEPLTPMRSSNIRDSLTASATAAAPVVGAAAAPPTVGSPGRHQPSVGTP